MTLENTQLKDKSRADDLHKMRSAFCEPKHLKEMKDQDSFVEAVNRLGFDIEEWTEEIQLAYLKRKTGGSATSDSSNGGSMMGDPLSFNMSKFKIKWLSETQHAFKRVEFVINENKLRDLLLVFVKCFYNSMEVLNTFLKKWAGCVQQIREAILFFINEKTGGYSEDERSVTQKLLAMLLVALASDLGLNHGAIKVSGKEFSLNLEIDEAERIQILENKKTQKSQKKNKSVKEDVKEGEKEDRKEEVGKEQTTLLKLTAIFDITRVGETENDILHNYEVKPSHASLSKSDGLAPREETMGQLRIISGLRSQSSDRVFVRGMSIDLFVLSLCWYDGTHHIERRIMEPVGFVLRLILSLIDPSVVDLCELITIVTPPVRRSNSCEKLDETKSQEEDVLPLKPKDENKGGGSTGIRKRDVSVDGGKKTSFVFCCGCDESQDDQEESNRKYCEKISIGVPALTKDALLSLGERTPFANISNNG